MASRGRSLAGMLETCVWRPDLTPMSDTDTKLPDHIEAEIKAIAQRHRKASGGAIELINALGGRAEGWMQRLPAPVRGGLDNATRAALERAARAAQFSRGAVPDQPSWVNSAVGAAMGAAGGFGGTPTALAELPVTITLLLRVIQGVAAEHGFDPAEENVQFDCLKVFGSAGPLADDDGAETAFVSSRLALNGAALQGILKAVAPRLGAALGQKIAAQSVPILGAAAGAAINYTYTSYYREMAHVQFRLRALAVEANLSEPVLLDALRAELTDPVIKRA